MTFFRRPPAFSILRHFVLLILPLALSGAVTAPVTVEIAPAKIERRTFDPKHPPAGMPKLTPPEVGTCVYQFACSTEAQAEGAWLGKQPAHVTEIALRATLTVTLWTPAGGPAKILTHEEGHREICEYYYDQAEQIGRRLAQRVLGVALHARTKPAMTAELDRLQKGVIREFLEETATRCDFAQARFDAITEHSMNPIAENVAIVRAIAAEEASYAQTRGGPGARPASGAGAAAATGRFPPTRPNAR
ncbi:hypothetical protein [Opitutus terrae]|uniref:DUF922 domain-containing protein n=1 Tax=Opitutus terrae (strain DSM 11246 / JCM 15787 / PB90-1) TaxID=452637 RepID=B1ZXP1_OPITP|nr:hypothetical protein [Opitutus terrae]ACB74263.1 hypothetical protein Oter_0975 [Opitutus terrae PB90-1]